jgi:hypothetical protein
MAEFVNGCDGTYYSLSFFWLNEVKIAYLLAKKYYKISKAGYGVLSGTAGSYGSWVTKERIWAVELGGLNIVPPLSISIH